MRIALIADLHGNLSALEAVLADLADAGVDRLVCLGDVSAGGPQPREVVARLRQLGCPVILGNTDADAVRPAQILPVDEEGRRWFEIDAWGAGQLAPDDVSFLRTFPLTLTLPLADDATLLCFHGSPRSNTEGISATTPEGTLARMLAGHSATVFAGGHTHLPFVRRHGQALVLNPGSVGLPYTATDDGPRHPAWAEYGLVEWRAGRVSVELRRVHIDVDRVVQAVLRSGMPHAAWLAAGWR